MLNLFKHKERPYENMKKIADKTWEVELTDDVAKQKGYKILILHEEKNLPELNCKACGGAIIDPFLDYVLLMAINNENGETQEVPVHNITECINHSNSVYPNCTIVKYAQCRIDKQKNTYWISTMLLEGRLSTDK